MTDKKYIQARDGEQNSVIYVTSDGAEFLHSGGTRAWRNNNPGNLVAAEKSGLSIGRGGKFAAFANREDGLAALEYSLKHFYSEKKLNEVFKKYAPSTDNNNPEHYTATVKKLSGLDAERTVGSLTKEELGKFMSAIGQVEGWKEGKIEPIPHARQFQVQGVDGKPLSGLRYLISFFTSNGEQKKIEGQTNNQGMTAVALSDTRTSVQLHLPRPDPGQSLKKQSSKPAGAAAKTVIAAELKTKPWYSQAFSQAAPAEDKVHDEPPRQGDIPAEPAKKTDAVPSPQPPLSTVKQAGAIQASGTQKKSDNHIQEVVKEPGVYVTWEFDTSRGSKDRLNKLPYFVAEMSGDQGKPLRNGQRISLMSNSKIREKVPFGKEVALYLGNDAKPQYRSAPLYRVRANEGLTDVVVRISEIKTKDYDVSDEVPSKPIVSGTKKTYTASLFGTTWLKFSHKFTPEEANTECDGEPQEIGAALQKIFDGDATVNGSVISLNVTKPNKKSMKIIWKSDAFQNCRDTIPMITGLTVAKAEIIPRVHPQTYKAFLKAAFELDASELEIASGWRPMLGSVLHRVGVGLDVKRIVVDDHDLTLNRSPSGADTDYMNLMTQKKRLQQKKTPTDDEKMELKKLAEQEASKRDAAAAAIHKNDKTPIREFIKKLRENNDVKQTFDPWEMDINTRDNNPATPNYMITGNEVLHRNHLHITVRDTELGY
ncbi:hypothetical protein NX786_14075 [Telluria mixta]|uniref:Uncharacterized protein n=1 Tax=Telluria mixta TaxID=34071 RepID=A0ABT2BZ90_9BURK|nr:hypothetical protein [Telluria mixta]MCS0630463.1 hypothetical protein [Telluria mixta]WEM94234.1 hypothetical protein P0M04_22425 [Telluria mixta]